MKRVTPELAKMGPEKFSTVMIDYNPWVVHYALAGIDYVFTEQSIFARPEIGAVTVDFPQKIRADKEIAARIIVHLTT